MFRKQLLVAKKAEQQRELFEKIHVGDVVEGTVKNVTDFGAFVDLGGADGLLHISEMSWGRVENPKKTFKVGDSIKVLIKDIEGTKIALSLKFEDSNPWRDAADFKQFSLLLCLLCNEKLLTVSDIPSSLRIIFTDYELNFLIRIFG